VRSACNSEKFKRLMSSRATASPSITAGRTFSLSKAAAIVGKQGVTVVAVPRAEPHVASGDVGQNAVPVPLNLVDPVLAARRVVDERRQAGLGSLRQFGVEEAGLARIDQFIDNGLETIRHVRGMH
jgi:hypothetical protein